MPEAITTVWPSAVVQTCIVHLIRASMRYSSKMHITQVTAALRPIYQAPTADVALAALYALEASEIGQRYPAIARTWRAAWDEFTPFLAYPLEIRRVLYTTNMIESLNARLRKATRNRGAFPDGAIGVTRSDGWKATLNASAIQFGDRINIARPGRLLKELAVRYQLI